MSNEEDIWQYSDDLLETDPEALAPLDFTFDEFGDAFDDDPAADWREVQERRYAAQRGVL